MSSTNTISPPARTWRDIPQNVAPRAMSTEGRKRLVFAMVKSVVAMLLLCAGVWGAFELWEVWQQNPTKLKAPVKDVPVRDIVLHTDGVLTKEDVLQVLALPKNANLMELDLFALRERLLATGQVHSAVLARKFPDLLTVVIGERSPVARIMVGEKDPKAYLIARDGVVFAGTRFDPQLVSSLPWIGGVTLKRAGAGFAPIEGMATVADLLGTAHTNAPALYGKWRVISLARLESDGEIVVTSTDVPEIRFGVREDFYKQIAQLDFIADEMRARPELPPAKSINLAVGGEQVPVELETPPAPPIKTKNGSARPTGSPQTAPGIGLPLRAPPTRPTWQQNLSHPLKT